MAKVGDVVTTMENIIKRSCDSVEVHTTHSEGEEWESFTVMYDSMTPELKEFISLVGTRTECIVKGTYDNGDTWSWTVEVNNQLDEFQWPDPDAPLCIFNTDKIDNY
jgi:hypothetical protein